MSKVNDQINFANNRLDPVGKYIIKYQITKGEVSCDKTWHRHGKKYFSIRRALQAAENMRKDELKYNDGYRCVYRIFHFYQ